MSERESFLNLLIKKKLQWLLLLCLLVVSGIGLWKISSYSKNPQDRLGSFYQSQAEIKAMQGRIVNRNLASLPNGKKEFPKKFQTNPMFQLFLSVQKQDAP